MASYRLLIKPSAASEFERYRLRQGDYRVLCSVDDASETVLIVKIGPRRDVQR